MDGLLAKFMIICIWKRMPQMDDNLLVRFGVIWAGFLSIWISLTGFKNKSGNKSQQLCSGDFSETLDTTDWNELTKPKPIDLPR